MRLYTNGPTGWTVVANLPNGNTVTAGELIASAHRGRLFAVITGPNGRVVDVVAGGEIDYTSPLPVAPTPARRAGVAGRGLPKSLRHRSTADGTWTDAGQSAALVPDTTTQIDVGGTVVNLAQQ